MRCPRCSHLNPRDAAFCEQCGAHLERACGGCGTVNTASARFCRTCGQPLPAAIPGHAPSPDPKPAPESYTPAHLAEKIRTSRALLEGERKQVTVLFADIKGSLELLANLDPEDARKLLDAVLEQMMEAVHHYEGTVNQVLGDGIMALFGAPVAHEDHAVRACYAALRMQEAVKRYADTVRRSQGLTVQMRVGMNSGEVVVRSIGNDLHMDYSAIGPTTHLAAQMEQIATPGSILITAHTLKLAAGYVEVGSVGPVDIKGLSAPVALYELRGRAAVRSRFRAATARGLTRFVGREDELEQLWWALERARRGVGQLVAVVGGPGVGKSRLVAECTRSLDDEWLLLETGAVPHGQATPYLPIVGLLKAYFAIEDRDDPRTISERIHARLAALDPALQRVAAPLLALLDVPVNVPHWLGLDAPQRRQQTLDAVKTLLVWEGARRRVLLIVEDLQWMDPETQALLDSVVEGLSAAHLIVIVTYRPEYRHRWAGAPEYTELRIGPLAPASAEALLEPLVGTDPALGPLRRLLIERTEGNPFFLEETVRTLVETGVLVGPRGALQLGRPLDGIRVPSTVEAVLASRIDRLPAEDKRLLQSAAVIGRDVPLALLRAIMGWPEAALQESLGHLHTAEFLYETRAVLERQYTFVHALTHEVAYAALLQEQRRALHARIVQALEDLYPERLAEHAERLAHHALRGEAWDKGVRYTRQAGAKALSRSAYQEAAACFERALDALGRLGEGQATAELRIDLCVDLRTALIPLGEHERIGTCLRQAETLARALDDQARLGRISAYLTEYFRQVGGHERADEYGRRALGIAEKLGDFTLEIASNTYLGQVCHNRGRYREAIGFFDCNVQRLAGQGSRETFGLPFLPSVHSRTWLVACFTELGAFADGILVGDEGLLIATSVDHPLSVASMCTVLGYLHVRRGDPERAIPLLERGRELCRAWGFGLWLPITEVRLGLAYLQCGRLDDARPPLRDIVESPQAMERLPGHWPLVVSAVEALARLDRLHDAAAVAHRALQVSRARGEHGSEAHLLRLLGDIAWRTDPAGSAAASRHFSEALALAERLEMRPVADLCRLGLGRVLQHAGDTGGAAEHLDAALVGFREMEMPMWIRQAEEEARRLRDGRV